MSQKRVCRNCKYRVDKGCTCKESKFFGKKWMARDSKACDAFKTK